MPDDKSKIDQPDKDTHEETQITPDAKSKIDNSINLQKGIPSVPTSFPKNSVNGNIDISGSNIQGGIIGIGGMQTVHGNVTLTMSGLTATIGAMNAAEDQKATLQKLIADLEAALKQAPTDQQANVEKIAKRAKEAVEEAAADQPDQEAVEVKANLLKKAAENVAGAMPVVLTIATSIVAHLLKLGI